MITYSQGKLWAHLLSTGSTGSPFSSCAFPVVIIICPWNKSFCSWNISSPILIPFLEMNHVLHFQGLLRTPSLTLLSPYELKVKRKPRRIYSCYVSRISQIWKAQLIVRLTTYRNIRAYREWGEKNFFQCALQSPCWSSMNSVRKSPKLKKALLTSTSSCYLCSNFHQLTMCCNIPSREVMPYHGWRENGERTRVAAFEGLWEGKHT